MPISVICPSCRAHLNVKDEYAGRSGKCPKCRNRLRVPSPSAESEDRLTRWATDVERELFRLRKAFDLHATCLSIGVPEDQVLTVARRAYDQLALRANADGVVTDREQLALRWAEKALRIKPQSTGSHAAPAPPKKELQSEEDAPRQPAEERAAKARPPWLVTRNVEFAKEASPTDNDPGYKYFFEELQRKASTHMKEKDYYEMRIQLRPVLKREPTRRDVVWALLNKALANVQSGYKLQLAQLKEQFADHPDMLRGLIMEPHEVQEVNDLIQEFHEFVHQLAGSEGPYADGCDESNFKPICPYCKREIKGKNAPKRRSNFRCPHCSEGIIVEPCPTLFDRPYLTWNEAQFEAFLARLGGIGPIMANRSAYEETKSKLARKFGGEPNMGDVLWAMMNDGIKTCALAFEAQVRETLALFDGDKKLAGPAMPKPVASEQLRELMQDFRAFEDQRRASRKRQ